MRVLTRENLIELLHTIDGAACSNHYSTYDAFCRLIGYEYERDEEYGSKQLSVLCDSLLKQFGTNVKCEPIRELTYKELRDIVGFDFEFKED